MVKDKEKNDLENTQVEENVKANTKKVSSKQSTTSTSNKKASAKPSTAVTSKAKTPVKAAVPTVARSNAPAKAATSTRTKSKAPVKASTSTATKPKTPVKVSTQTVTKAKAPVKVATPTADKKKNQVKITSSADETKQIPVENNDKEVTIETSATVVENINKLETNIPTVVPNENDLANQTVPTKKTRVLPIFAILLASFIALIIISFLIFSIIMHNTTDIFSGVYIKNVDVSNLSVEDANNKISKYIASRLPEEITLVHGDYEVAISTAELKIDFNIESAVKTAHDLGRDGNIVSDGFTIISMMFENKNVEPNLTINEEVLTKMLNDISSKLPDKVIESGYYIDDTSLILNKGTPGTAVDVPKMKAKIIEEIKNLNIVGTKIEIITKNEKPKELNIDNVYKEVKKNPVDASFTANPLSIKPSENGIDFDISIEDAKKGFASAEKEYTIPLKVVYPNVTTNMIGQEAFPDVLSEFSTLYAASNVNRTTNLMLAAEKINGTVLMPDEVFSYNQVVGERTIAAGYKEAPIYVEGRVEDGLGGGICQITTTLYNAVVYANLEIVERTNHQFVPSYIGAGLDATVVYGAIDFQFKNNRKYPIKILCSVDGGVASFQILGLRTADDYEVEIRPIITSQTANAINSETYKILMKDGNVVDQVFLSRDTYRRH